MTMTAEATKPAATKGGGLAGMVVADITDRKLAEEERLRRAASEWAEANPMIGIRGVRLAVMKPGLYAMQVRALLDAVSDRVTAGGRPMVEVMIPLTVSRAEVAFALSLIHISEPTRPY